jgi:hypothetical protein
MLRRHDGRHIPGCDEYDRYADYDDGLVNDEQECDGEEPT